jgi:3-deoxy-D-manno-octulosonic acid kinase
MNQDLATTKVTPEKFLSYQIGSIQKVSEAQKQALIREFNRPVEKAETRLSGRVRPQIAKIEGLGRVLVKHYFRGGILRHLNRRSYLKIGKTRSAAEFEALIRVRAIGVSAPEPLVYASISRGVVFYQAWLVLKEVQAAESLAALALTMPDRAETILPLISKQIKLLIRNKMLHVDLHPGNILVDADNRIYLIDFDKMQTEITNKQEITKFYVKRWQQAIAKHNLPIFLKNLVL